MIAIVILAAALLSLLDLSTVGEYFGAWLKRSWAKIFDLLSEILRRMQNIRQATNTNTIAVTTWKTKTLKTSRYLFRTCRPLGKVNNATGKIHAIVIAILITFGDIIDKYLNG